MVVSVKEVMEMEVSCELAVDDLLRDEAELDCI